MRFEKGGKAYCKKTNTILNVESYEGSDTDNAELYKFSFIDKGVHFETIEGTRNVSPKCPFCGDSFPLEEHDLMVFDKKEHECDKCGNTYYCEIVPRMFVCYPRFEGEYNGGQEALPEGVHSLL